MGKFLFLERPRLSPETARTAGSCGPAEGHRTPAVSPAPLPQTALRSSSGPAAAQICFEILGGQGSAQTRTRAHSALQRATKGILALLLHERPFFQSKHLLLVTMVHGRLDR